VTASLWTDCLKHLEGELSPQDFNTWIRPLHAQEEEAQAVRLLAPNRFVLDWVKQHFSTRIMEILTRLNYGQKPRLLLQVGSRKKVGAAAIAKGPAARAKPGSLVLAASSESPAPPLHESPLNPTFTFQNFVPGNSNQLARSAALQAADVGGFNPLYIYGGVGLGKTHLMQAVGNHLVRHQPKARVLYLHSERFVADMVKALQNKMIDEFKNYYRSADILLVDDIQFLAGKVRSQEEFFHTFNALIEGHQQVIVTCDRTPNAIQNLDDRLKSRLNSGLTVAVEPPELDTRLAILQAKAAHTQMALPEEVAHYIAEHVGANIRELEGALHRLSASAKFMHQEITLDFSKEALKDLIITQVKLLMIQDIQQVVADYFKVSVEEMLSKRRHRYLVRPRQMAIFLTKELTRHSLPTIGEAFGGRDRTTVLHSCKSITSLKVADPQTRQDYLTLRQLLGN